MWTWRGVKVQKDICILLTIALGLGKKKEELEPIALYFGSLFYHEWGWHLARVCILTYTVDCMMWFFSFGHWTAAQCLGLVRDKKEKGEGGEVNMRHPKGNDCDGANYLKDNDPTEYVKEGSPFESNWCAPRTVRWSDKKGSHQRV